MSLWRRIFPPPPPPPPPQPPLRYLSRVRFKHGFYKDCEGIVMSEEKVTIPPPPGPAGIGIFPSVKTCYRVWVQPKNGADVTIPTPNVLIERGEVELLR